MRIAQPIWRRKSVAMFAHDVDHRHGGSSCLGRRFLGRVPVRGASGKARHPRDVALVDRAVEDLDPVREWLRALHQLPPRPALPDTPWPCHPALLDIAHPPARMTIDVVRTRDAL